MKKATKTIRIQALLDLLGRWGRLDKTAITHHLENLLSESFSNPAGARAIYRDLQDLVEDGRIAVDYYTRDGVLIEDYDPDKHKNVSCFWYIPSQEGMVPGAGVLETLNSSLYVPNLLKNDVSLQSGSSQPDPRNRHIYFLIGTTYLCLKISFNAFPFKIIVSRTHGNLTNEEIECVANNFGKRCMILKLPYPKLSSYKSVDKLGHCILKFDTEEEFRVEDFKSTNGTILFPLKTSEADKLRSKGALLSHTTLTSTLKEFDPTQKHATRIDEEASSKQPAIIELSDECFMLII